MRHGREQDKTWSPDITKNANKINGINISKRFDGVLKQLSTIRSFTIKINASLLISYLIRYVNGIIN